MNRTRNLLSFGMSAALDQPRIVNLYSIVNRKLAAVLHKILSICSVGQENCRPPRPRSPVMDTALGGSTVTSSAIPHDDENKTPPAEHHHGQAPGAASSAQLGTSDCYAWDVGQSLPVLAEEAPPNPASYPKPAKMILKRN